MFKLFPHKPKLESETSLSRFVKSASSAEKKKVYNRVIIKACEEQRTVLEAAKSRRQSEDKGVAAHA